MSKDIQEIINQRQAMQPQVKTEFTNYEEYLDAQTRITRDLISKPAITCELCGYPMNYKGHKLSKMEAKWSIHDVCRDKAEKLLDRDSGITRERKGSRVNMAR